MTVRSKLRTRWRVRAERNGVRYRNQTLKHMTWLSSAVGSVVFPPRTFIARKTRTHAFLFSTITMTLAVTPNAMSSKLTAKTLLMHGGSETMVAPSGYSDIVKGLLDDLGVDPTRFETAYDQDFYKRNGLATGLHFNKETWGVDRVVPLSLGFWEGFVSPAESPLTAAEAVAQMPISESAKTEFLRFVTITEDQLPDMSIDAKTKYLYSISYRDFLTRHLDISEAEVFAVLQDLMGEFGIGVESISAYMAMSYVGLPGRSAVGLPRSNLWSEPYIHHFPDGNASIARLLVRAMVPGVASGNTMEDIVTAPL